MGPASIGSNSPFSAVTGNSNEDYFQSACHRQFRRRHSAERRPLQTLAGTDPARRRSVYQRLRSDCRPLGQSLGVARIRNEKSKSFRLYRECVGAARPKNQMQVIAGELPMRRLGGSRPTLAGRLLCKRCPTQRTVASRNATAESAAAQSS